MLASIKKGDLSTMEMTNVHTVTWPSIDLKDTKKERINQKLGPRPTVSREDGPPAAGVQLTNELLMAMLAVHSANSQRQKGKKPRGPVSDGINGRNEDVPGQHVKRNVQAILRWSKWSNHGVVRS